MYFIVEFCNGEGIAVIPDGWIHKEINNQLSCYWPPTKNSKVIQNYVEGNHVPCRDSWSTYEIRIIKSFADYHKARSRLNKAQNTSDLSDTDHNEKRISGQNFSSDSSSNESEILAPAPKRKKINKASQKVRQTKLPAPPSLFKDVNNTFATSVPKENLNCSHTIQIPNTVPDSTKIIEGLYSGVSRDESHNILQDSANSQIFLQSLTVPAHNQDANLSLQSTSYFLQPSGAAASLPSTTIEAVTPTALNFSFLPHDGSGGSQLLSSNLGILNSGDESFSSKEILCRLSQSEFQQLCIRNFAAINVSLKRINSLLEENVGAKSPESNLNENEVLSAPLTEVTEFGQLDQKIAEQSTVRSALVKQLSLVGGDSTVQIVNGVMAKLLTDKLATSFTYEGMTGKKSFSSSNLKHAVFESIRKNRKCAALTDTELKKLIMSWFIHSKERVTYKERTSKK